MSGLRSESDLLTWFMRQERVLASMKKLVGALQLLSS